MCGSSRPRPFALREVVIYEISYSPKLHAIEIRLLGFLTAEHMRQFAIDLIKASAAACNPRYPDCIYDFSGTAIQSQEVVEGFREMARNVRPGRRVAVYSDGQLARLQAKRVVGECPTMELFESRAEATAWLMATRLPAGRTRALVAA